MTDKPKPFSAEAFLEWVKAKPAAEEYDYWDRSNCAGAQFVAASDYPGDWFDFETTTMANGEPLANFMHALPNTFGQLADRLEKAIADQGGKL